MPASPIRRPRRSASLFGVVLTLGLLAGCAGQRAPGSYTDGVKKSFVEGCWTTLVSDLKGDAALDADGARLDADALRAKFAAEAKTATTQCTCAFAKLKKDVSFGDFKSENDDQTEEPGKLPSTFTKAYASCGVGEVDEG